MDSSASASASACATRRRGTGLWELQGRVRRGVAGGGAGSRRRNRVQAPSNPMAVLDNHTPPNECVPDCAHSRPGSLDCASVDIGGAGNAEAHRQSRGRCLPSDASKQASKVLLQRRNQWLLVHAGCCAVSYLQAGGAAESSAGGGQAGGKTPPSLLSTLRTMTPLCIDLMSIGVAWRSGLNSCTVQVAPRCGRRPGRCKVLAAYRKRSSRPVYDYQQVNRFRRALMARRQCGNYPVRLLASPLAPHASSERFVAALGAPFREPIAPSTPPLLNAIAPACGPLPAPWRILQPHNDHPHGRGAALWHRAPVPPPPPACRRRWARLGAAPPAAGAAAAAAAACGASHVAA